MYHWLFLLKYTSTSFVFLHYFDRLKLLKVHSISFHKTVDPQMPPKNTFLCGGQSAAWKVRWSPDASHVTGPSQGETSVTLDGLWSAEQEAALEYEFHICNAATIFSFWFALQTDKQH